MERDAEIETNLPPEPVEDRPNVSEVVPEDYPLEDRTEAIPVGTVDDRGSLEPGEWDRPGAGEIESDYPSTVGAAKKPGSDVHTSAGD